MDVVTEDLVDGPARSPLALSPWLTAVTAVAAIEAAAGATEAAHKRGWITWRLPYVTDVVRARSRLVQVGAWGAMATVLFDHLVTRRVFG